MDGYFSTSDSEADNGIGSRFLTALDAYEILEPLPSQQPEENYKDINESAAELPKANFPVVVDISSNLQISSIKCVECGMTVQKERSFSLKKSLICAKCSATHNLDFLNYEEPDIDGKHKKCSRCRKQKHISYFYDSKGKILQTCQKCLLSRSRKYFIWKKERMTNKKLV